MIRQGGPDGADVSLQLSIIDILQRWTVGKKIARCLKVAEQNKATVPPAFYAKRFCDHLAASIRIIPDEDAIRWQKAVGLLSSIPPEERQWGRGQGWANP